MPTSLRSPRHPLLLLPLLLSACGASAGLTPVGTRPGGSGGTDAPLIAPRSLAAASSDDRALLAAVNAARGTGRDCGAAHYPAAAALTWDDRLAGAALSHSRDMAMHGYLGTEQDPEAAHLGSDGSTPQTRVTDSGYPWTRSGENVAAGYSAQTVVAAWLASPGHCANLMNADYTQTGVSELQNPDSRYRTFFTQVFATP